MLKYIFYLFAIFHTCQCILIPPQRIRMTPFENTPFNTSSVWITPMMDPTPCYNNMTTNRYVVGYKMRNTRLYLKIYAIGITNVNTTITTNDIGENTNEVIPSSIFLSNYPTLYNLTQQTSNVASIITYQRAPLLFILTYPYALTNIDSYFIPYIQLNLFN